MYSDNNDMEQWIREKADTSRMLPSDRIWLNIRSRLHKGKNHKWPELMVASVVVLVVHIAGVLVFKPNYHVLKAPFNTEYPNLYTTLGRFGNNNFYPRTTIKMATVVPYQELYTNWLQWKKWMEYSYLEKNK